MADEGVSIGNYKGVMLCNRPAGGAGDPVIRGGAGEVKPVPFKAGVPPELVNPRGYDPSLQERLAVAPAPAHKQLTALQKHKAWLSELKKKQEELRDQELLTELQREERKLTFMETQKAIRDAIRGVIADAEAIEDTSLQQTRLSQLLGGEGEGAGAAAGSVRPTKKKGKEKPAWALTAEEADAKEEDEADSLLEFVGSLDFESYVDDVEVRAALEAARQRISALSARAEEEASKEGSKEGEGDEGGAAAASARVRAAPAALTEASLRRHAAATAAAGGAADDGDDTKSLADSVLSSTSSIKQIHSRKSLAAVIERTKKKGEEGGLGAIPEELPAHLAPLPKVAPPVVAVVDDSAEALASKKKLVSQLAFLNRNPAV